MSSSQPPASNPGAGDATGGIPKGAGGSTVSSAVDSPVPGEQKTLVGVVMETLGLSGQQEKRAEDVTAHAPDTTSTSIPASTSGTTSGVTSTSTSSPEAYKQGNAKDQTYVGAIGGAAAAGTAAVASYISGNSNTSHESSGASTSATDTKASTGTTTGTAGTTGTTTAGSVTDSAASTAKAASDTVKETVSGDKTSEHKSSEPNEERTPAKVSDHQAAIRENKDAIPTAGGQRLGEGHWGESKVVPDNPKPKEGDASKVSSKEGQPDQSTVDNTAKNTGGATEGPQKHGHHGLSSSGGEHEGGEDKQSVVDKLKHKLHLDKKDKS